MFTISGTYENGSISLDEHIQSKRKMKVIVTFLEESIPTVEKRLRATDFSFRDSREKTKRFKGSLSDSIIEGRRVDRCKYFSIPHLSLGSTIMSPNKSRTFKLIINYKWNSIREN
jgi:hypothetical protein